MEDIKVGDYVRTEWGDIEKIIKIDKENIIVNIEEDEEGRTYCKMCYKNEIKKSSPNIIDLIEVGDYVNGKKVILDLEKSKKIYNTKDDFVTCKDYTFEENEIKSVVTKEMMKSIEYRVD